MPRTVPTEAYAILGVLPTDDFATIRKAWLRQVRLSHPDVNTDDTLAATRKLALLNDAYDELVWHHKLDADAYAAQKAEEKKQADRDRKMAKARKDAQERAEAAKADAERQRQTREARLAQLRRQARIAAERRAQSPVTEKFRKARNVFETRKVTTLRCA